jgi:hypothetical protein
MQTKKRVMIAYTLKIRERERERENTISPSLNCFLANKNGEKIIAASIVISNNHKLLVMYRCCNGRKEWKKRERKKDIHRFASTEKNSRRIKFLLHHIYQEDLKKDLFMCDRAIHPFVNICVVAWTNGMLCTMKK